MTIRVQRRGADQRGAVMVMAALLMTVMIGFAGFAVDLGWWYSRGVQIQRAADAASLAAAVWMPDEGRAKLAAEASLKTNGFVDLAGDDIEITYTALPPQRYQVKVRDSKVEAHLSRVFTGKDVDLHRTGTAEYQLAIPLGSPWNHFGTGTENIYASVNGFCTSKEDGDQILSRFDLVKSPARCPSTASPPAGPGPNGSYVDNVEYRGQDGINPNGGVAYRAGYSYYIDLPKIRTTTIRVALFDAAFFNNTASSPDNDYGGSGTVTTTYRLRTPDATPLDDTDNPVVPSSGGTTNCGGATNPRSFATNDATFGLTIGGSSRYTLFCTIPTTAPGGKYILDVYTTASQGNSVGANAYGLFLEKGTSTTSCDARIDLTCPRVYGTNSISVYANQASSTATFYLAEIAPVYAGKTLRIELWDPGEGGNTIKFLNPKGVAVTFNWTASDGTSGSTTSLNVTGSTFNDKKVTITTAVPADYANPLVWTSYWWQIQYNFTSGTVTDRTTWSVNILDLPVHLVP